MKKFKKFAAVLCTALIALTLTAEAERARMSPLIPQSSQMSCSRL